MRASAERCTDETEQAACHGPNELVARQVAGVRVTALRNGDGRNRSPEGLLGVQRAGDAVSETCAADGLKRREAALDEPVAKRQALEQVDPFAGSADARFVSRLFRFSHPGISSDPKSGRPSL